MINYMKTLKKYKTNYVVAGDNMGPSKRVKAESLQIPILSEADFLIFIK